MKSYLELITIPSFEERLKYLQTGNAVGDMTFGGHRYLNQMLYRDSEWKNIRRKVILRDSNGSYILDLAHPDFPFIERPYVHHINAITVDDILNRKPCVFDLNNLICCSFATHQLIHYGKNVDIRGRVPAERSRNDTCPWR